ncbi:hypothetical protein BDV95DRAFT_540958 [Massariosphaeria phaeospora]|uniref:Rhodopsin domain-containing protein n=1 Tax=Massariosphaeria phaeospora TaxID=100035 RepID=A0A7C8MNQ0_9PLEO|nr:hypothetical protein BDV95DRAFT_540958 [Massariosphaeria phaeospora]
MIDYARLIEQLAANPPDPNQPKPLSNRPETILGVIIPFQVLSLAAAISRLYVRYRVVREPGWDDYFIILASVFNLAGLICVFGTLQYGLGEHLMLITVADMQTTLFWCYLQAGTYYPTSAFVKLSLLSQYLRLFRKGPIRIACFVFLVLVSIWGVVFSFMGWFPCFPPSGYWDRMQTPAPKCWALGYGSVEGTRAAYIAFSSTNVILDVAIFSIPVIVYMNPSIERRQVLALMGLFTLGSAAVLMSILRLWVIMKNSLGYMESFDFTWWYPLVIIISSLEIDFAIVCASMPIFWPVMVTSLAQIFVTKEVHVVHHRRLDEYEMDPPHSLKSNNSQEGLTRQAQPSKTDYNCQYVADHVTGRVTETAEVEALPKIEKSKWRW